LGEIAVEIFIHKVQEIYTNSSGKEFRKPEKVQEIA